MEHGIYLTISVYNTITFSKDTFELISNYRVPRCLESIDIKELTAYMWTHWICDLLYAIKATFFCKYLVHKTRNNMTELLKCIFCPTKEEKPFVQILPTIIALIKLRITRLVGFILIDKSRKLET